MSHTPTTKISPAALLQTIRLNLMLRPLLHRETAQDCLCLPREEINKMIKSGELAWAFEVGKSDKKTEPRILTLCVVEKQIGPIPAIGASKNLRLDEVVDLILPQRDIRSTELKRILSCGNDWFRANKSSFKIVQPANATDGPNSYCVISRASVGEFLAKRRIL